MRLFGDLISALTMFFVLLAVVGLGISMHETTAFFLFSFFFCVVFCCCCLVLFFKGFFFGNCKDA